MQTDFLVIGSGISGLNFALNAAKKGKVIIITKKKIIDSSTNFAQGGIAAVLDKTDNYKEHIKDTLEAGAHHNNKKAVEFMVKNSAEAVYKLIELGVEFEKEKDQLKLTREGGHHKRRIAYVGDYTGKEIERILVKRVKEHPNITIYENTFALKLIIERGCCYGVTVIHNGKIANISAQKIILATGGIGQIFRCTTNPKISTGDGIGLALEAGCEVKDMEFIQFHPTALAKSSSPLFLISETVRGEGAKLINSKNERFMEKAHSLKELAPRDIVAREIYKQQKNGTVYLDIRHKDKKFLKNRFPQIYKKLRKYSIDMSKDLIPVTPAAHYLCGGIVTNLKGQTKVKNLFAFGEVAWTGVHGANRLASNSLLEALVFSNQIIKNMPKNLHIKKIISRNNFSYKNSLKLIPQNFPLTKAAKKLKKEIQKIMWQYAGIVRNLEEIEKFAIPELQKISIIMEKIHGINQEIVETKNMAEVGLTILKAAHKRKNSLGCHFIN